MSIKRITMEVVPSGEDRIGIKFWLKPHLWDFVRAFVGGKSFAIEDSNPIGAMARSVLVPKRLWASRTEAGFSEGRKDIIGYITVRSGEYEGVIPNSPAAFEVLVEHLFYNMLITHVDAFVLSGFSIQGAILRFTEQYTIAPKHVNMETLRKTIRRRRERMQTGLTNKFIST